MITGFDHLAFTARDVERDVRNLLESGYEQTFHHVDIQNPSNKRNLMHQWSETHTLAMYEEGPSVPIELIGYGHLHRGDSRYVPLDRPLCDRMQIDVPNEVSDALDLSEGETDQPLPHIAAKTDSLSASREFWTAIGFERLDDHRIVFELPFGTSLEIVLIEDDSHGERTPLDAEGFPCVAFLTSSIEKDLSRFEAEGYEVTSIEPITFPKKTLRVSFVVGPSGEPVELVEPATE